MELKVLILDDEAIILDGLCSFPWENYGCCVVGSAGDGVEGLKLAGSSRPDIILSDIKMPDMDGLTFAEKVKEQFPDTEIIMLTGYDSFAFAQQALRIGVCEYLLKPVNFHEMHDVLMKVCDRVRQRKAHKRDYSELRRKYRQTLPQVRSKLIMDLLYGRLKDRGDMAARMKQLDIKIEKYVCLFGRLQKEGQDCGLEPGLFDFIVLNICKESLAKRALQAYAETDTLGYCLIAVFGKDTADQDCMSHCQEACGEISGNLEGVIGQGLSFGISLAMPDPYEMNAAYKQAMEACEQGVYMDDGVNIIQYGDIADSGNSAFNITEGEKKRIYSEIMRGNIETAKAYIDHILGCCEDMEVMRHAAMGLFMGCFQYAGHEAVMPGGDAGMLLTEGLRRMYATHRRSELLDILKNSLEGLSDRNRGRQLSRNQRTTQEILAYIEGHYSEDLSLDSLSDRFRISKTYINRLLKNNTGKSFLEVLLDRRLTKAEELIAENRYKVYEVAEMAGYHDMSYFIKAFKKKYGVTPNTYRRK